MLKNLQLFPLRQGARVARSKEDLTIALSGKPFSPCNQLDRVSVGWVSPFPPRAPGLPDEELVCAITTEDGNEHWMIALQVEVKLLPAGVVKDHLETKVAEITNSEGHKPGRKRIRELKEEVESHLLTKAFTQRSIIRVWIDVSRGWVAVDTSSRKRAEEVLGLLAKTLPAGLEATRFDTRVPPTDAMTRWLANQDTGLSAFTIDQDCTLESSDEDKPKVAYTRHNLDLEEVARHLKAGKVATKLALTYAGRVSFVLTKANEIRRLKFVEKADEAEGDAGEGDARAAYVADCLLFVAGIGDLVADLTEILGGRAEDEQLAKAA